MTPTPSSRWLDYRQAAKRVGRDIDTIRRWRRNGMAMSWRDGARIVREDVLLEWFRARLLNDPIMASRRRAMTRAATADRASAPRD